MLSNEDGCQFPLSGGSAEPAEWHREQNRTCQSPVLPGRLVALVTMAALHDCQADWWRWWRCPQGCSRSHEWRLSQEAVQSWLRACSTFWRAMSTKAALCLLPSTPDSLDGQLCTRFPRSRCPSTDSWPPNSYLLFKRLHIVSLHYQNSGCCVCSFHPCLPALLKQGQTVFLINPGWVSIFCIISDVLSIIMDDSGSVYFMPR